ncbi:MAG: hypothetical protein L0Y56_03950 [Nitrospira sp.]|nr:hypothetical protein [Nitrospira sp.]
MSEMSRRKESFKESPREELSSQRPSLESLQGENETLHRELTLLRGQTLTPQKQSEAEKKRFFNEVEECVEQIRSLVSVLILTEQQERSRVSHLLHDDLRRLFYSLLIRLEMVNLQFPTHRSLVSAAQLNKIIQEIDQAINLMWILAVESDLSGLKSEEKNLVPGGEDPCHSEVQKNCLATK